MFIHLIYLKFSMMRSSNFDKIPFVELEGNILAGWPQITDQLQAAFEQGILAVDLYPGVYYRLLAQVFQQIPGITFLDTGTLMKPEEEVLQMTERFTTRDALFGYLSPLQMADYFDAQKLEDARQKIRHSPKTLVFGYGAALVAEPDVLVYADMPRWEIQMRMRRHEVDGLGVQNRNEYIALQYKRGLFNDWRVADRHKKTLFDKVDFWLDTVDQANPKMIPQAVFTAAMDKVASRPFRVVPFFDPAPWGGQWMKEVCDLDRSAENYGWCFDCVPEENSLMLKVGDALFEMPSVNLVYTRSKALLGEQVEARFGKYFPIRFDFLDTMGGGNLSLQVHPTTAFIQQEFGMPITQDESYYLLDAEDDAVVYLGVKNGVNPGEMIRDLEAAQENADTPFDADHYIHKIPAKKHDHFLIPAGTVHCSGTNSMVLEISATPFLFTFKLWDWGRLGLDGKPRPINIDRGKQVINWQIDADYANQNLVNQFEKLAEGEGWVEEKTGLHPNEYIETIRHRFSGKVTHQGNGSVQVFNLVEGEEAIIESPQNAFEPYVVHYAETFIIPAAIREFTIRPHGLSEGKEIMTLKAFVRL